MKIIVLKENLKNGLSSAEHSINNRSSLPILKNVLIKTMNNKINISSTNLELAITHSVAGKIFENGSLTIPAQIFNHLINNLSSERINLEKNNYNLIIKTDNYEALIQGLNPEDFPIIPQINDLNNYLKINSNLFKESLIKVLAASQFSEIRPEINGVLFDYQINNFKLVVTDSFRLAEKTISDNSFTTTFDKGFKVIIPLKTTYEILKIFKQNEDLEIFFDPNQIFFRTPEVEIISRLIDGNYPDYNSIIPQNIPTEVFINKNELITALKLANVFTSRNNEVKLKISENKKTLEIYSADSGVGENRYLVPIKTNGPAITLSFNLKYLIDGLKVFENKEIILALNNNNKPSMIKSAEDNSFFYVLMPIKN